MAWVSGLSHMQLERAAAARTWVSERGDLSMWTSLGMAPRSRMCFLLRPLLAAQEPRAPTARHWRWMSLAPMRATSFSRPPARRMASEDSKRTAAELQRMPQAMDWMLGQPWLRSLTMAGMRVGQEMESWRQTAWHWMMQLETALQAR